jgi:hypothetical protein
MKVRERLRGVAFLAVICVVAVHAQGQNLNSQSAGPAASDPSMGSAGLGGRYAQRPVPAARGVSSGSDPQPYDPSQVTPDTNTLAGAQLFGVGSLTHARNIFDPSFSFSELGGTFPSTPGQTTPTGTLSSTTMVSGSLNFNRTWSRYHLTTIYNGGETFNRGYQNYNTQFHDLNVTQEVEWAKWHLLLRDDFVASAGAAFTGTGMGGPGLIAQTSKVLESSLNGIGQGFVPSETIQTANAMRYRNAALGQLEYSLNRRSAFTFSGSYGLLQFTDAAYISSHMLNAQAGYDYLLNPANSIAVLASYGKIDYTGTANTVTNYVAELAYGRKITGRLAFQVAAGPEQIRFINGMSGQVWYGSVNSALTYQGRRAGYSLSFMRGLSSGSGIFLGAKSNTLVVAAHDRITRFWTGSVNSGYAINDSLAPAGSPTVRFENWFVGGNLGRQLGSHFQMNFSYGVQRQHGPAVCPIVGGCGVNGFQQTFGITVNGHLRRNE